MLTRVADGPSIVVCNTCRQSADAREGADGVRGGVRLAAALRAVKQRDAAFADIDVQEMACLFACTEHCAVHVRAPGKISYVLGRFEPTEEAAYAILEYAARYVESAHGRVAFALWPQGVKGHFITRAPPLGLVAE